MFVLDTNVLSELRKVRAGRADTRVATWAASVDTADLFVSAISIHELQVGVLRSERKNPAQGTLLRAWLNDHVLPAFDGRILPFDTAVALRSAQLSVPDTRPLQDGMIAATALAHGMTVVTRNLADFQPTGVRL